MPHRRRASAPPWLAALAEAGLRRPRVVRQACAVAEAIFGGGPEAVPAARIAWLGRELDDHLEHAGPAARASWLAALAAVTYGAPLLVGRPGAIGRLPVETRIAALSRLEQGPAAAAMIGVKALLCILYYEHPDAAAEIGFDAGCLTAEPARPEVAG